MLEMEIALMVLSLELEASFRSNVAKACRLDQVQPVQCPILKNVQLKVLKAIDG